MEAAAHRLSSRDTWPCLATRLNAEPISDLFHHTVVEIRASIACDPDADGHLMDTAIRHLQDSLRIKLVAL